MSERSCTACSHPDHRGRRCRYPVQSITGTHYCQCVGVSAGGTDPDPQIPWRSEDDARQAWELVEPIIAGGTGEHAGTLVVDGRLLAGFATRVEQRQAANDRLREALQRIERVVADKVNAGQLLDAADALEVLTFARRALAGEAAGTPESVDDTDHPDAGAPTIADLLDHLVANAREAEDAPESGGGRADVNESCAVCAPHPDHIGRPCGQYVIVLKVNNRDHYSLCLCLGVSAGGTGEHAGTLRGSTDGYSRDRAPGPLPARLRPSLRHRSWCGAARPAQLRPPCACGVVR